MISVLDFAGLPPEINSGRMYAGPGSGPLVTAAAAWGALAAELNSTAGSYREVLAALTGAPWVGPSASTMAAAAAPYLSWMSTTATQAQQTASQLGSAAAAYEAAFAATVPPGQIEVNRAMLASLVATNSFGQNTAAIATTEAQYAEMWAQDAAAMYSYAGTSAAATTLTPFSSPPQTTNPTGAAAQSAVTQNAAAATDSSTQTALASVPDLLQSLSTGAAPGSNWLLDLLTSPPIEAFNSLSGLTVGYQILSEGLNFDASGLLLTIAPPVAVGWNPLISALSAPAAGAADLSGAPAPVGLGGAGVSAGVGDAVSVGKLSVPSSWGTSPAVRLAATAMPIAGLDGLPRAGDGGPGFYGTPPMGPLASVVNAPRDGQTRVRAGQRHKVIAALPGETGMDDPAARWVKPTAPAEDDSGVSERDELTKLRKAIADVARQRDVLKRTAATLIKEGTQK